MRKRKQKIDIASSSKTEQNKRKSESRLSCMRAAVAFHYQDDESNILLLIVVVWATCGPHRWQSARGSCGSLSHSLLFSYMGHKKKVPPTHVPLTLS